MLLHLTSRGWALTGPWESFLCVFQFGGYDKLVSDPRTSRQQRRNAVGCIGDIPRAAVWRIAFTTNVAKHKLRECYPMDK